MLRLLLLLLCYAPVALAQPAPLLDGTFEDWDTIPPLHTDPQGEAAGLDLHRLWVASDEAYLYLSFEVGAEINLQTGNALTLVLDTDDDPSTGASVHGLGAELSWTFGALEGVAWLGATSAPVRHSDLGLLSAPTVSGSRFEVAIRRDASIGGRPFFNGPAIRLALRNGSSGDVLPDTPGGLRHTLQNTPHEGRPAMLARADRSHLRVLSYNVLRDGLFAPANTEPYRRLFRAIDPDIIALQEVYDHGPEEVATRITELHPLPDGAQWHAAGVRSDVLVVSRFPVTEAVRLCDREDRSSTCNGGFRLDLRPYAESDLYLLVAHPPCCRNDVFRQQEIDLMMAHLRDARATGALEAETPILIAGDLNLVGDRRQLNTLLTGEIVGTTRFGAGAPPDGDGTSLADAAPLTTGLPANFTWINPSEAFSPGRLDVILYGDSRLAPGNGYVLHTPSLTSAELTSFGLGAGDTNVSDHLPVVQDFALRGFPSGAVPGGVLPGSSLGAPVPNPVATEATLGYSLEERASVRLALYDPLGRLVRTMEQGIRQAGAHRTTFERTGLAPGVYFLRLETPVGSFSQGVVLR